LCEQRDGTGKLFFGIPVRESRESGGEERDMSGIKEWIDTMFI
jgi:hypothetical protein